MAVSISSVEPAEKARQDKRHRKIEEQLELHKQKLVPENLVSE